MPSYTVRPATLRDARTIASIHAQATETPGAEPLLADLSTSAGADASLSFWREAIEFGEPQVQVALTPDNKIIGFVGYDRSRDPGTKPTVGELWAIYVLPAYWDTGAGLALWDAAREGLVEEGCTQVTVWLSLGNERALRFHELAGFKRELNSARTVAVNGLRLEEIRLKRASA
jgi:GNAT superfamily N-acetyltransferase